MRIQDHWNKAMRLEATREGRLDMEEDYEIVIWACIHGGAHLANVALHKMGVTDENFDLIHSNIPEHDLSGPEPVAEMLATLKAIEELGPRFVRGIESINRSDVQACLSAYAKVKGYAEGALGYKGGRRESKRPRD